MASDDDDFALIGDEAHSHPHHTPPATSNFAAAHHYIPKPPIPILPRPHPLTPIATTKKRTLDGDAHNGDDEASFAPMDTSNYTANSHHHCFASQIQDEDATTSPPDHVKRKERDEISDGESPSPSPSTYCFNGAAKKAKDREEWSDAAIGCLLDAYSEKYVQLNRGNLRGKDWEEVAVIVNERGDKRKSGKSVEQCKNKVDNLKKRYKVECQRIGGSGGLSVSHWHWFKRMEEIVGFSSSSSTKAADGDEDKSTALGKQSKRYSVASPASVSLPNNLKMKTLSNPRWKRVVLKISGSAFSGSGPQTVDPKTVMLIAREIAMANHAGVEVAVVVGGRNFFCGDTWIAATGVDRATVYQIGMMAASMNCILLQTSLEKLGVEACVQTGFTMQEIAEPYIRRRAIHHLEKGRIVIFCGIGAGTGSPLFTTDTGAALRASEIHADALLKGTNVGGVYGCHSRNSTVAFEHISFRELVSREFNAMDTTALTFCEKNNLPVVLFNLLEPGNISRALCGDQVGTLIDRSGRTS